MTQDFYKQGPLRACPKISLTQPFPAWQVIPKQAATRAFSKHGAPRVCPKNPSTRYRWTHSMTQLSLKQGSRQSFPAGNMLRPILVSYSVPVILFEIWTIVQEFRSVQYTQVGSIKDTCYTWSQRGMVTSSQNRPKACKGPFSWSNALQVDRSILEMTS